MMQTQEVLLLALLLIPTAGAALLTLFGRQPNLREAITFFTAGALLLSVVQLIPAVVDGQTPQLTLANLDEGLSIQLKLEPLGMVFAVIASGLWLVNSLYSVGYMRGNKEHHQTRFFAFFALSIAATLGIACSGNLLTLFVFYELLTILTFPLVTHHGDKETLRGGRVYLTILLGTSMLLLLPAIIAIWAYTGTTEFRLGGILDGKVSGPVATGLLALCLFGIGKAALMPFHLWLPNAMVAPTPVSALLHAVAVVKAGVFSVTKVIVYTFGIEFLHQAATSQWLLGVAGFSIVVASIVALQADNLKRRLAFSTVSQLSYVTMSALMLVPLSIKAAILHIAAHAVGKITLFFAAGAIYTAAHKTKVSELNGIGRRMPWTMTAFAVASLSMIGLPPTFGFISKWFLVSAALDTANIFALSVVAASTLLNAAYFLPIIYAAFFKPLSPADQHHAHGEAPWQMVVALTITALATVVLFFIPSGVSNLADLLI
jgi:multicomponent Na+:H+ antiporter subunit D